MSTQKKKQEHTQALPQTHPQQQQQQQQTTRVIVKNTPKHMTTQRLHKMFSEIATITDCKLLTTKEGKSRQFGFVGFLTHKDAKAAIKHFNNTYIDTSRISVHFASPVGDSALTRPWSRHSQGSSAFAKQKKIHKGDSAPENKEQVKKKTSKETSASLRKFLAVMSGEDECTVQEEKLNKEKDLTQKKRKQTEITPEAKLSQDLPEWEEGRLFVRNISFSASEEDLIELFGKYGKVSMVNLPVDPATEQNKGFAFIQFMIPEDAINALEALDASVFQGRLIHVLPAKPNQVALPLSQAPSTEGSEYKRKKEAERKATAASSFNWNSLWIRQETATEVVAEQLGISKAEFLDPHESTNAAVRVALAETHTIAETKTYLEEAGVNVSVLESCAERGGSDSQSATVLLIKNLPASTTPGELAFLLRKHGHLTRFLLPPSCALAIIEYQDPSTAAKAFNALAYRRFKHLPLFVERAPASLFKKDAPHRTDGEPDSEEPEAPTEMPHLEGASLFVKNLNFSTVENTLKTHFEKIGVVRSVSIPKKKDLKNNTKLSMGYGFVEFSDTQSVQKALRTMQGTIVDGHNLELSISKAGSTGDTTPRKAKKRKITQQEDVEDDKARSTKLIVRNVPFEATKKDIRELFSTFAQVKSVRLPKKFNGKHRGFAFVEFLTKQEALNARNSLKNTHLYGRHLVLEWAATDDKSLSQAIASYGVEDDE